MLVGWWRLFLVALYLWNNGWSCFSRWHHHRCQLSEIGTFSHLQQLGIRPPRPPTFDCHPIHIAPDLYGSYYWWWSHMRMDPCLLCGLSLTGLLEKGPANRHSSMDPFPRPAPGRAPGIPPGRVHKSLLFTIIEVFWAIS